jgi:hypothetical protein
MLWRVGNRCRGVWLGGGGEPLLCTMAWCTYPGSEKLVLPRIGKSSG